jgi:hypothetical protein
LSEIYAPPLSLSLSLFRGRHKRYLGLCATAGSLMALLLCRFGPHRLSLTQVISQVWIAPHSDLVFPSIVANKDSAFRARGGVE